MRKTLSILIVICLICSMLGINASAEAASIPNPNQLHVNRSPAADKPNIPTPYYNSNSFTQNTRDIPVKAECTVFEEESFIQSSENSKDDLRALDIVPGTFVTVDKPIIGVGVYTEVTVHVQADGAPIADAAVGIGPYAQGTTDSNGNYSALICPEQRSNVSIQVNGSTYRDLLYALNDDEGLIEVTATDMLGNNLVDFRVEARNDNMNWSTKATGNTAKAIAREGLNNVLMSATPSDTSTPGYYMQKPVAVTAHQITQVVFDCTQDAIEANFNVVINGVPFVNAELDLRMLGSSFDYSTQLGRTDAAGNRTVYVTPGSYALGMRIKNKFNEVIYLYKDSIDLTSSATYPVAWSTNNTGKAVINFAETLPSTATRWIKLNNYHINLGTSTAVYLEPNTYQVGYIGHSNSYDGQTVTYDYSKPTEILDTITVLPQTTTSFSVDLNIDNARIQMHNDPVWKGSNICFNMEYPTRSGYYLNNVRDNSGTYDYNSIDVVITKPTAETVNLRQSYRHVIYNVRGTDPEGRYTIDATANLGPYYSSSPTATASVEVIGNRELTVDTPLMKVGQTYSVKFTVTSDGVPVVGEAVTVEGSNLGYTDSNGVLTADIYAAHNGSYEIRLGERNYFNNVLFAANEDEGLVQVTVTDIAGVPLENFRADVRSQNMWWGTGSNGPILMTLAREGSNTLKLIYDKNERAENYFVIKDIDITAGIVNPIHIDCAADTIGANMIFSIDGQSAIGSEVSLNKKDASFGYADEFAGNLNSSSKTFYVSPGLYNISLKKQVSPNEMLYLTKDSQNLTASGTYDLSFDTSNTGKVRFNFGTTIPSNAYKAVVLDDHYLSLGYGDTVIMEPKSYVANNVAMEINSNGNWNRYEYFKDWRDLDTIHVITGQTVDYSADLGIKQTNLYIDNSPVYKGNSIFYRLELRTNSDYNLNYIRYNRNMDVTIEKPNAEVAHLSQDFGGGSYYIDADDPEGIYTISASLDLGTLYNTVCNAANSFEVIGKKEIFITKPIIKVGEPTQVTITATSSGIPIPNQEIRVGEYAQGSTDANGNFTVSITPQYSGNIPIYVGSVRFENSMFAVHDDEGVVEATVNDIYGNPMQNFNAHVGSANMGWGSWTNDQVVRLLAKQGTNVLKLASSQEDGYYIVQEVNVQPGIMNTVHVNAADVTIETVLNMNIDNNPTSQTEVYIEKTDVPYKTYSDFVGQTDQLGNRKVYMSPGSYTIGLIGRTNNQEALYLYKVNQVVTPGVNQLYWDTSNTSRLNMQFGANMPVDAQKFIVLNQVHVNLNNCNTLILNSGDYKIDFAGFQSYFENQWIYYQFRNPSQTEYDISILPNTTTEYDLNLDMREVNINVYGDDLRARDTVYYEITPIANCGYILDYMNNNPPMQASIYKPNGEVVNLIQNYWNGRYTIQDNDPAGAYVVSATVDLGPQYGTYTSSGSFNVIVVPKINITEISPANGALDVPVDKFVTVYFDKEVQPGSRFHEIILKTNKGVIIPCSVMATKNRLVLRPNALLSCNTAYTVFVPQDSIIDYAGSTLAGDFTSGFTTIVDKQAPVITGSMPSKNATGVPITTPISVKFDENISLVVSTSKYPAAKVTLKASDGTVVPIIYSVRGNILDIKPMAALKKGMKYTITIPAGVIADVSKNKMGTPYSFSFTTQPPAIPPAPTNRR